MNYPPKIDAEAPFEADAELHDWGIATICGTTFAFGKIYNDKAGRWHDGTPVRTSYVQRRDGDKLWTRNTRYLLVGEGNE